MIPENLERHRLVFVEAMRLAHLAPATIRGRRYLLGQFLAFLAQSGIGDVREVTRETVRAHQLALSAAGLAVATRIAHLRALRWFFAHLERTDVILLNPCAGLREPKRDARLPRTVLTRAQARRILARPDTATPKGVRDRAILELFYATGLRAAELAALTIGDVDLKNEIVRVARGKGGHERVTPMGRQAAEWLRAYLHGVRREWSRHQPGERALWLSRLQPHRPVTQQAITVMACAHARAAGIAQGRAHLWRHTCATHLLAGGASLATVQRLLGHRSLDSTQLYTRVAAPEVRATHARKHPRARTKPAAPMPPPPP